MLPLKLDKIISLDNIGISLDKIDISFDNSNIGEAYRYCKTNLFTYKTGLWNYYIFDYEVPLFS